MIQIKYIILNRAEGLTEELQGPRTVATLQDSDAVLQNWARTAPDNGAYHKCDFCIVYDDGHTYSGRYDLKRHDAGYSNLLSRHITNFVKYMAGLEKNPWNGTEQYQKCLKQFGELTQKQYKEFFQEYQIG